MIITDFMAYVFSLAFGFACGFTIFIDRLRSGKWMRGYRGILAGPVAVASFSAADQGLTSFWFIGSILLSVVLTWQLVKKNERVGTSSLYPNSRIAMDICIGLIVGAFAIARFH